MNILQLISAPAAGGAENFVRDLSLGLVQDGHAVHIAFLSRAGDIGRDEEFQATFLSQLVAGGVTYSFVGHECRFNPLLGVARVRRLVRQHRVDVYHSHMPYGVLFGVRSRAVNVYTHHSVKPRGGRVAYWICNRLVDEYIAISDACARVLAASTGRAVTTIRNGVDPVRFSSNRIRRVDAGGAVRIVMVGRLHPDKNYPCAIEAVAMLPLALRSRLEVAVAGAGTPEAINELQQLIEARQLAGTFNLLGNLTDMPTLLAEADIFLMSSSSEGFPVALLEATMAGLPCVVTDVGGCREIVESCSSGIVVPAGDAAAIASALQKLTEEPSLVELLSKNAAENSNAYDIGHATAAHVRVYEGLLS